jgi:hypothetical protein
VDGGGVAEEHAEGGEEEGQRRRACRHFRCTAGWNGYVMVPACIYGGSALRISEQPG